MKFHSYGSSQVGNHLKVSGRSCKVIISNRSIRKGKHKFSRSQGKTCVRHSLLATTLRGVFGTLSNIYDGAKKHCTIDISFLALNTHLILEKQILHSVDMFLFTAFRPVYIPSLYKCIV